MDGNTWLSAPLQPADEEVAGETACFSRLPDPEGPATMYLHCPSLEAPNESRFTPCAQNGRGRQERFSMRNSRCTWALIIAIVGLSGLVHAQNPANPAAPPAQAGTGGGRGGRAGRAGGFTGPSIS